MILGIVILIFFLLNLPVLLLWHLVQCSQTAVKGATSMLVTPLADCSSHIVEDEGI